MYYRTGESGKSAQKEESAALMLAENSVDDSDDRNSLRLDSKIDEAQIVKAHQQ